MKHKFSLLRNPADRRQLGIVSAYLTMVFLMYFWDRARHPVLFVLACGLSFLNAVVIHNHLHVGIFKSHGLNRIFRCILSFGSLYPASANIPSHNLVHHRFNDDGAPDWAAPTIVKFRWNLLNLLHFPNINGTQTFNGVQRWMRIRRLPEGFKAQYILEQVFAFGLTGVLLALDFWNGLFFVVVPQLWGARGILRINLIQHEGCDTTTEFDHSRNFVGRAFNWVMCNNGFHTVHHNLPTLHWSVLKEAHQREVVPRMSADLDESSMVRYLLRTFVLGHRRERSRSQESAQAEESPTHVAAF